MPGESVILLNGRDRVSPATIMPSPAVIAQTLRFLAGGGFGTGR